MTTIPHMSDKTILDLDFLPLGGQTIHPDVIARPAGCCLDAEYYMVVTPFALGRDNLENPEFLVSSDGISWRLPSGGTSPLVPSAQDHKSYNSDPALYYDQGQFHVLYREVLVRGRGGCVTIFCLASADGLHWRPPVIWRQVLSDNHVALLMSPATVEYQGARYCWYVSANEAGILKIFRSRVQDNALTQEQEVAFPAAPAFEPWHIQVVRAEPEVLLMTIYGRFPDASKKKLAFALSRDGGAAWQLLPWDYTTTIDQIASLYRASLCPCPTGEWFLYLTVITEKVPQYQVVVRKLPKDWYKIHV